MIVWGGGEARAVAEVCIWRGERRREKREEKRVEENEEKRREKETMRLMEGEEQGLRLTILWRGVRGAGCGRGVYQ